MPCVVALGNPLPVYAEAAYVFEGSAGFVVSEIEFALADDADKTQACPLGMSKNLRQIYASLPEGERRKSESVKDYDKRISQGASQLAVSPGGENLCMHPEAGEPDPHFRVVEGNDVAVFGIDLDGKSAESDFQGVEGNPGVDNQFYRVVGCIRSYQSTGQSNDFARAMLTGAWGILIKLSGIESVDEDDSVEVGVFANADPIQLSAARDPLPYATYTADTKARFRSSTTATIKNGVLTTEPFDVVFHYDLNSMYLERPLRDARLIGTISQDGVLEGYLAGYTPVEAMYDVQFGFRNGTKDGKLAPVRLRAGSANGAASVLGYTCHGAYHALYEHADGHMDPETGRFTSISTQYKIKAIPAFVVTKNLE